MELSNILLNADKLQTGHSFTWPNSAFWTNAIGDANTAGAFFLITFALYYFVKHRPGLKIKRTFLLFASFIFLCGLSHFLEVVSIWYPLYSVEGIVKLLTGATAIAAVFALAYNIPLLLKLPSIRELADANAELQHKRDELKTQNEFLRNLAYSTYHDLREPIRGMAINSQVLLLRYADKLPAEAKANLEHIAKESKRMFGSVESILKLTFLESEKYKFESTTLNKIIENAENRLQDLIVHNDARIIYSNLPEIEGNESLLEMLFENIIANSIRFRSDADPEIEIKAEDYGLTYAIIIKDNGIGFNNQYNTQIFEMFKTLGNSPTYKGSGLGLAMSKRIAEIHGGSITAQSVEEVGTVITVILPKRPKARKTEHFSLKERYTTETAVSINKTA